MEESWGTKEFKGCAVEDQREAKIMKQRWPTDYCQIRNYLLVALWARLCVRTAWRIFSKQEVDISCGHYNTDIYP